MSYVGDNAIEMDPVAVDNIGSLAALIMPELPDCSDFIVRQQLAFALREFCRVTDACIVSAPLEFVHHHHCGCSAPMPSPPQDMVVGSVIDVVGHDGRRLGFETHRDSNSIFVRDCWERKGVVRFSVYPKVGGEVCPEWFKERYAEAIVAGAMHHLLTMRRPWADPQRGAEYGAKYTDAIAEAAYRRGSPTEGVDDSAVPCGGLFM